MRCKILFRAIADGVLNSIYLFVLGKILLSNFVATVSLATYAVVTVVITIVSFSTYQFLVPPKNFKAIILFSVASILSFVFSLGAIVSIEPILQVNLFVLRELNNADGLVLLFAFTFFLLSSLALKICFLAIRAIRGRHKK